MIRRILPILIALLTIPMAGLSSIPGKYEVLIPFSPPAAHSLDRVTVYVVFAFDCGHCYHYHRSDLKALENRFRGKLKVVYQPIGWRGQDPGRLYFIAEEKGKGEAVMGMIFDFLFDKGLGLGMFKRDKLQFVAQMNGLEKEFRNLMDDPRIVRKMEESIRFSDDRKIDSTPTVVVEGVMIAERGYQNMATIINALLKDPVN